MTLRKPLFAAGLLLTLLTTSARADCTFNWHHYGAVQVYKLLNAGIGAKVTDEYCKNYNKTHEIVVITDSYASPNRTLAHVSVGLRKKGSKEMISKRYSAYKFEDGNFVVAKSYEMAAALALDTVMDVMSDLGTYAN